MKRAIYAGSFDPVTRGHLDIISRALELFDFVEIVVGVHPSKNYTFSQKERVRFLEQNLNLMFPQDRFKVTALTGRLLADYAYESGYKTIVKGVRNSADFDYERMSHDVSFSQQKGLETCILVSRQELSHVSSSAAKEICRYQGLLRDYVPLNVKCALERKINNLSIIGVTGVIGAGKSFFVDKGLGLDVINIDLDKIAHGILFGDRAEQVYIDLREKVKQTFKLQELTRKALGDIVFNDSDKLAELNRLMREPILTRVRAEIRPNPNLFLTYVVNGALLVEADFLHLCNNIVIVITADEVVRWRRLQERGLTDEQIRRRLDSQLTTEQKISRINREIFKERFGKCEVIDNSQPRKEWLGAKFLLKGLYGY